MTSPGFSNPLAVGVLKDKNKFFVDSRTTVETIGETTMKIFDVPTASRNVFTFKFVPVLNQHLP